MSKDGGSAFPIVRLQAELRGVPDEQAVREMAGMTLRDWFAGMAMQSFDPTMHDRDVAKWSYARADAMLQAREKE